jgi:DNA primase
MNKIPQLDAFKEEIRERTPIEAVIQRYGVQLKRKGRRNEYVGLCPFHADQKTESLHVYAEQGRWWCYGGCVAPNKGGDVFKFVMLMEKCDFKHALENLANCHTPDQVPSRARAAPTKPKRTERPGFVLEEEHCAVLGTAAAMYHARLARATHALTFLRERCIHEETIRHWRIGYADGTQLLRHLTFKQSDMVKALEVGLVKNGREHLRGRLTFPSVRDDRAVFMIGRALDREQKPPYLGLPLDKPLYYDGADSDALEHADALVVEGPLDLLTLWQWTKYRQHYALFALQGTYLSAEAISLFERFDRIYTALDADSGGESATGWLAGIWGERMNPVRLPKGMDVNDLGQQVNGERVFDQCMREAGAVLCEGNFPVRAS